MELVADDPDYKEDFLTGYFRDGKRRIDLVIVTKDTADEQVETMKMTFLMNAINMGLDVEIEAGSGDDTSDLNFIKVHAPDHILQHFGVYYNIKKYFKISHLEFVNSGITEEKELIQIIRRWYPTHGFSTFERSQIAYMVLLSVTFGSPENFVGINQLVDNNVILDVYPLHDGPRIMVPGQSTLELNARQALFYNWCGYENLFRQTPVNLVREYLGERVGFFFAFYQFYNCFLLLLAVFGLFVFSKNYDVEGRNLQLNEHNMKNSYDMMDPQFRFIITERPKENLGRTLTTAVSIGTTIFKYPDMPICPRCKNFVGCPVRVMEAYRTELISKLFLDNPLLYYMAFATAIWGILLYLLWRRKENYWYWLWETNEEDAKSLTRPAYRYMPKPEKERIEKSKKKSKAGTEEKIIYSTIKQEKTFVQKEPKFRNVVDFCILILAIFLACIVYPGFMIELGNKLLNKIRAIEDTAKVLYPGKTTYPDYLRMLDPANGFRAIERLNHVVCDFVGSLNGIFIIGLEILWFMLEGKMMKRQASRSEWQYERKHVSNMFGMTILINCSLIGVYAFIKGAFYTFPDDDFNWHFPLQLGLMHCGLLYCTDEVFLVFTATHKTKLFVEQIMCTLTRLPTDDQRNPKDYVPPVLDRTPCWEREFNLLPINEDFITIQYNRLFLQIAVLLCFITVFPLAALIIFFWNLWNIKYLAKLLVVHSRRPLVTQKWGLGAWRDILFIIPYVACFTNALYLVRNNSFLDRKINLRYWSHREKRRFFADYFLSFFNMSDYNRSHEALSSVWQYKQNFPDIYQQTKFCLFPSQYNRVLSGRKIFINYYAPMAGKWYKSWHQSIFIISFTVLVAGVGFLLDTSIGSVSEEVQDTSRVEEAVKQYDVEETLKSKFD